MASLRERWAKWFRFDTCGNESLSKVIDGGMRFVSGISGSSFCNDPHWFTLLGPCGTGKTHIARRIYEWWETTEFCRNSPMNEARGVILKGRFVEWAAVVKELRQEPTGELMLDLAEEPLLVVDDLGSIKDTTGFITGELVALALARMGKWTVWTSNLTLAGIESHIDARVASRIARLPNAYLTIDAPDYGAGRRG